MRTLLVALLVVLGQSVAFAQGVVFKNPNDPSLDTTVPTVAVVSPTSGPTYDAGSAATLSNMSGTSSAPSGIAICRWSNSLGGAGTANTSGNGDWLIPGVSLTVGSNVITVSCQSAFNVTGTDVLTVTRSGSSCTPSPCIISATGTLTTGSSVTIAGLGFGTHADYGGSLTYLVAAWNNFQQLAGCAISADNLGGGWILYTTPSNFFGSTTNGITNDTCHIRKQGISGRQGEISHDNIFSTGKASARFKFLNTGPFDVAQGKMFRAWADQCDFFVSTWGINTGLGGDLGVPCAETFTHIQWGQEGTPSQSPLINSTTAWNDVAIYWCDDAGCGSGDPSSSNYMVVYVNGVKSFENGQFVNNSQWIPAVFTQINHTTDLGELLQEDGSQWGFDDALYDHTWSGVALCSTSTWAACTNPQWMPSTIWNSNGQSITVEWNNGIHSSASGLYLYVMDEHLTVTSGFLLP